ncbi:MAG: hypothetical protein QN152_08280 [Armatimonadota bacterium]|nr:hypothetical protein [Armatimonadota bacterium]MDR7427442.1 hypothetical protein [Armatimonadota bacterium]MDR7463922.1 hypothetical protein [Armatimonadota bacterium]MDR7468939.1 hypothetical protein [Armatimonadota bacterium]MDR7475021.1 hypothetical protein [Armatimonadota bacterium]
MPEFLKPFLRYWSLTLAVFVIYLFAFLAAIVDVVVDLQEQVRKKRATVSSPARPRLDPNPLRGRTIAQTFQSPGQRMDAKRQWVHDHVATVLHDLGITARALVLEDSRGHPFIQVSDGRRLVTYRVNREAVEQGRAGDANRIHEIRDYLRRHLTADFLGQEEARPPRTTELAREARPARDSGLARATAVAGGPTAAAAAPAPPAARRGGEAAGEG